MIHIVVFEVVHGAATCRDSGLDWKAYGLVTKTQRTQSTLMNVVQVPHLSAQEGIISASKCPHRYRYLNGKRDIYFVTIYIRCTNSLLQKQFCLEKFAFFF